MKFDAEDLRTKETDERGRLYLGTEYANKRVTVAVVEVEVESESPDEEELAAAYRDASKNEAGLTEEWDDASDEAWTNLGE